MSVKSAPKAVRLQDVALRAGVSSATASKALNDRGGVSKATRAKVLAAVEELGYQPVSGESMPYPQIALVADDLTTTYTLEILKGAISTAMEQGVALGTFYLPEARPSGVPVPLDDAWLDLIKAKGYLGVIVLTARLSDHQLAKTREIGLPLVAIDPANALPADVMSIGATNWNGGVEAAQHLVGLGHRRIGFVQGPPESVPATERLQGYVSALHMNGLTLDSSLVVAGGYTHELGMKAGRELLSRPVGERPTAIVAPCDPAAMGVCEAARQLGIQVPAELSVVGFDDTVLAGLAVPGLTTVHQPLQGMGAAAVRRLLDVSTGRPVEPGHVRLATRLVIRHSTAPVAQG
ncbi:LacI family DNA-binding transcriptional regulator [Tessaracoccus sp. Z1128]